MKADSVSVRRSSLTCDKPEVRVIIGDMHLVAAITNDRVIRLANRLAEAHGVKLHVDPALAEMVGRALFGADQS